MKKFLSLLLCAALLAGLAGCSAAHAPVDYTPSGNLADEDAPIRETQPGEEAQTLSLAYYQELTMNPLVADDFTNRVIISLVYQGLFATNRDNEVVPILCKSYTVSTDLMTYDFTIDPAATFSDGVPVTPEDVVASLQESKNNRYYGQRLRYVTHISVTEDREVRLQLSHPYGNLPVLLDIPIVKATQTEIEYPLGTGPYMFYGFGSQRKLVRRTNWWCKSEDFLLTAEEIPLVSAESPADIRDSFEFYDVGVVCTDPGSDRYAEYRCDYELWDCESGIMLFLGVNKDSPAFQSAAIRQALSKGIDRDMLVDKYYRGFARSASLPASPGSPYYTASLAKKYAYDPAVFQSEMQSLKGHTISILVNSADSLRVRVAQEISRAFTSLGIIVEVDARENDDFRYALNQGDYDLYLGQTRLSPNMDLTPFFDGYGSMTYGGMDDIGLFTLALQALENQGNYYTLHQTVMEQGYLCPILFRSYAVYAARGLLTDLEPSRDNVFCYSIGKTLTDAYVLRTE